MADNDHLVSIRLSISHTLIMKHRSKNVCLQKNDRNFNLTNFLKTTRNYKCFITKSRHSVWTDWMSLMHITFCSLNCRFVTCKAILQPNRYFIFKKKLKKIRKHFGQYVKKQVENKELTYI